MLLASIAIASRAGLAANTPKCTENLDRIKGSVIAFGFEGSYPYSVEIDSEGKIVAYNPKRRNTMPPFPPPIPLEIGAERSRISPVTVKTLVKLATQEDFWQLPESIGQAESGKKREEKNLAMFVSVNLPCAKKRVVVRDGKKKNPEVQKFAEVFMLLKDLVYRDAIRYKPLR